MFDQAKLVTYVNGRIMPHTEAIVVMQAQEMQSTGGFYDNERTFNGKLFKLEQHLQRLFNGLSYTKIDPGITKEEMETLTAEVLEANLPLLGPGDEYIVTQVVSVGATSTAEDPVVNVVIYCQPLDFAPFARSYARGVRVVTPSTYGVPQQETQPSPSSEPQRQVYPLMTGQDGSITECKGGNFMFVRDGRIKLPDRRSVLPGVSMHTVLELADGLGIAVDEGDYSIYDVYRADEAFVSSTRNCMLPVASINGLSLGGDLPGPTASRLLDAWREMVGIDFVRQALDRLERSGPGPNPRAGQGPQS